MEGYRLDIVASLARQLEFAPLEVRRTQLAAVETLVYDLDPAKLYPPAFVVHRATGYHPRESAAGDGSFQLETLAGDALRHDLGRLIEQVSNGLNLVAREQPEPVLSIDDVTERFNVTSKTIQRWRKRGLISRRFTFADGKKRVGFLLSSIERFVARNGDAVVGEANVSRVESDEVSAIVSAARRLVAAHRLDEATLAKRLARRFRRSALTVRHTLRKHDLDRPESAVLGGVPAAIDATLARRIARGLRRRVPIARIARRLRCSRTLVYHVALAARVDRLTRRRVRFHDDELYHTPDAELAIAQIVRGADAAVGGSPRGERVPRGLPPYLADLYRVPLLSPQQERALFLAFNYRKSLVADERRRFDPESARSRDVARLAARMRDATEIKNRIVAANLRLVVSVARKHLRPAFLGGSGGGPSLMELVSEGNLILMRAVEGFDVHKNVRFSTYATYALMTGFARIVPQWTASHATAGDAAVHELPDPRTGDLHDRRLARDEVRQLLSRLDADERRVIGLYYGLDDAPRRRASLGQIGRRLGLSKHRVRQLERAAISKLRAAVGG